MTLAINKFMLSVNIIGGRDKQRTKSFEILASGVDDATKRSNAHIAKDAILTAFGNVSSAFVQGHLFTEHTYEDAAVPGSGLGNVFEEVAVTVGLDVGGGKKATITIPSPADAIFVGNSGNTDDVDTADTALIAFVDQFINDGSALGAISDGEQFESPANILSARYKTVKTGKTQ
jgi:hypothetical protein